MMVRTKLPKPKKMVRTKPSIEEYPPCYIKSVKNPGSKPVKWRTTILREVFELARFGMTNREIAEFYQVNQSTIDYWGRTKPEFKEALDDGRLRSSLKVVDSVYKEAVGYKYVEEHKRYKITTEGEKTLTQHEVTSKYARPNITAAIYLLKVRHGDKWMDVVRTEVESTITLNMHKIPNLSELTQEEQQWLRSVGLKKLTSVRDARNN